MQQVPLAAVPNQTISFTVDGAFWSIRLFQAIDQVYADVSRNGELLIRSTRCLAGQPLMPYKYMYAPDFGNFIFDSDVDWTLFGELCNLYYLELSEYEEFQRKMLES